MKNESAAALGKLARGKPKSYSKAELERRTQRLVEARKIKAQRRKEMNEQQSNQG